MSNQELRLLIKNELEYLKFLKPKLSHLHYTFLYKKYKITIDKDINCLDDKDKASKRIFHYINNLISIPLCHCGNQCKFHSPDRGYQKTCSCFCGRPALTWKQTKKDFIKTHGNNKFKWFEETYTNTTTKMKIQCLECGVIFEQTPDNHKRGAGCSMCSRAKITKTKILKTYEDLKIELDNYKTSFFYCWGTYVNSSTKMLIICMYCGHVVWQNPAQHKRSLSCAKCYFIKRTIKWEIINKQFISKHGNNKFKWFEETYTNSYTNMKMMCLKCHSFFWQQPAQHKLGAGCPFCNVSKGEEKIKKILDLNNIKYIQQYRFIDCKFKKPLPFDFYLPELNACIEFDGEGHYMSIDYWGGDASLKYTQNNDKIKNDYCSDRNIKLIRIPYWERDNIEEILNYFLK